MATNDVSSSVTHPSTKTPSIALTDLSVPGTQSKTAVSSSSSLSQSTSPPSTPASSIRPSVPDRSQDPADSTTSRSPRIRTRSSSSAAEQALPSVRNSVESLPPIVQGAVPSSTLSPAQASQPSPTNAAGFISAEHSEQTESVFSVASWLALKKSIARRAWAQNSIGLAAFVCAVITTAFYTYRAYKLAKWTALKDYFENCWNQKVRVVPWRLALRSGSEGRRNASIYSLPFSSACQNFAFYAVDEWLTNYTLLQQAGNLSSTCENVITRYTLPDPPYVDWEHLKRRFGTTPSKRQELDLPQPSVWRGIPLKLLTALLLMSLILTGLVVRRLRLRRRTAFLRPWDAVPSSWPLVQERTFAAKLSWDAVPVRLEGPISTSAQVGNPGFRRRVIPPHEKRFVDYRATNDDESAAKPDRKKSFQDHFYELWDNPAWRNGAMKFNPLQQQQDGQTGSSSHDVADLDRVLKPWSVTEAHGNHKEPDSDSHSIMRHYKNKVRHKLGLLHDDDDGDDPLTALGADPESPDHNSASEEDPETIRQRRRVRIKSGAVSVGLAHSGAAAAVPGAGEAGQDLFVQEVGANENVLMPTAPQDVSLGAG